MGVQFLYHATNAVLDEFLFVDGVHIQVVNSHFGYLQLTQGGIATQVDAHLSLCGKEMQR